MPAGGARISPAMNIDWEGLIVGFESRSEPDHALLRPRDGRRRAGAQARHRAPRGDEPRTSLTLALPRDEGERSRGDLEEFLGHCEDPSAGGRWKPGARGRGLRPAYRETLLRYPKRRLASSSSRSTRRSSARSGGWRQGIRCREDEMMPRLPRRHFILRP